MNKPTDYPIESTNSDSDAGKNSQDITYAELRNRINEKKPITDEMISNARRKMETAHGSASESVAPTGKLKLGRIRAKFRAT